jgi:hypothetical protein
MNKTNVKAALGQDSTLFNYQNRFYLSVATSASFATILFRGMTSTDIFRITTELERQIDLDGCTTKFPFSRKYLNRRKYDYYDEILYNQKGLIKSKGF